MQKKSKIKVLIEKLTNSHIFHNFLPAGVDIFYDLNKNLKGLNINTIFDVGANIGQSTEKFLQEYPKSKIYCFEPVSSTFKFLEKKFTNVSNISCHNFALGANAKSGYIVISGATNDCSYIDENLQEQTDRSELIDIKTLDSFCNENGISKIDFLKIDTEGKDLDVLKGAENLLSNLAIGAIQVEASMNNKNERHVPFEVFKDFFESKGYFLFKIYEQVQENESPVQRRSNPVFIPYINY